MIVYVETSSSHEGHGHEDQPSCGHNGAGEKQDRSGIGPRTVGIECTRGQCVMTVWPHEHSPACVGQNRVAEVFGMAEAAMN